MLTAARPAPEQWHPHSTMLHESAMAVAKLAGAASIPSEQIPLP